MTQSEPLPDALEPAGDRDRHINLGFEAYRPVRPIAGKVRAENLLWFSLLHAGLLEPWDDALKAVQRRVGRDRSVFGVFAQLEPGARTGSGSGAEAPPLSWEVRVLNTDPRSPLGILDALRETLAPWVKLAPGLEQAPPYAVLALRFGPESAAAGELTTVDLHERSPGTHRFEVWRTGAAGRERVSRDLVLHPKRDIDEVLPAIKDSEFVDFVSDKRLLGRVMIPELFACRRLHVCKRPDRDALTFSGLNIEQLLFCFKRFELPEALLAFVTEHQDGLEHLLFDVTVEYRGAPSDEGEAKITYPRVGFWAGF